jgi:hypothetical protein
MRWLVLALAFVVTPCVAPAYALEMLSVGAQGRIGEGRVLGETSPESFHEYDVITGWRMPWEYPVPYGLSIGPRLFASLGVFEGPDKTAAVASVIPVLALGTLNRRITVDAGAGLAVLSAHRYGQQDFGGYVQFALTVGAEVPLYKRMGVGYRFMHYSDAGLYSDHTVGADLHMLGLIYHF